MLRPQRRKKNHQKTTPPQRVRESKKSRQSRKSHGGGGLPEVAHDKAEKEAAKAERAARKQEQEAAKAERAAKKEAREKLREEEAAAKEHKEPCVTCRKTVSLSDHTCKKEDLAAVPKKPTAEETFVPPKYSPGDSDEEPLSRQRSAALAQLRPMQAWYAGRLR